ncbi:bifunctional DNA-formamidopyrimidine glycosylase/DNA-(apurinic or apyrimidinic site) lyase [Candidatus Annandia pinicola]|uniref:bifunctional DNA-formamidopyrimidine glycosylase/DNA-(apurinic or apyrimidinic site) lyase n=1 Tax=Candidatus Annandia pinicola TaxID=1345117 RepID=UPI001D00728D|nr:bifunctional DNA-formamidopyrimidine glycosylase/DNA-(apurinic or apyrimidinic site) lyase [Candidatus Annandia pinicola]UDG80412.1 Formamidopyrimidine-DNA glycosylase [Candidatus Annandia pinicola]
MPELPEIETICKDIRKLLLNKIIIYSIVRCKKLRKKVSKEIINIKKNKIINIKRIAKYIIIKIELGYIIIHLGMSGSLFICSKNTKINKHDHVDLIINNNKILRYNDPRRFGLYLWSNNLYNEKIFLNLGIEPLSKKFNLYYLFYYTRKKKIKIKDFIMDNKFVVGIGNIYANEVLFNACILPYRLSMNISLYECNKLINSIKYIIKKAIKYNGTTIKNFIRINKKKGNFKKFLKIYGKKKKKCKKCNFLIKKIIQRGRSTFFCNNCQK